MNTNWNCAYNLVNISTSLFIILSVYLYAQALTNSSLLVHFMMLVFPPKRRHTCVIYFLKATVLCANAQFEVNLVTLSSISPL